MEKQTILSVSVFFKDGVRWGSSQKKSDWRVIIFSREEEHPDHARNWTHTHTTLTGINYSQEIKNDFEHCAE